MKETSAEAEVQTTRRLLRRICASRFSKKLKPVRAEVSAVPTRFELATSALTGRRALQTALRDLATLRKQACGERPVTIEGCERFR